MRPLAIDLYAGLGGWSDGLLSEGWDVIGFDIEWHIYSEHHYPAQLVIQDVLTLHGSQFRNVDLIVASPPCQFFSYTAMPWSRAKVLAAEVRADPVRLEKELALFNACFRIQREACEAAGRHIPMVVENVRGAIPWVGRSRWNFGSYHLWGDVPALMPSARAFKIPNQGLPQRHPKEISAQWRAKKYGPEIDGIKQPGICGPRDNGKGNLWFQDGAAQHGSKSPARKAASAMIAKIPEPLARHIARVFKPETAMAGAA